MLDIEEFVHYSSRANGSVHLLIPKKMFFFCSPEDLPENQCWVDISPDHGSVCRRFGPQYYADLFEEMGVTVVASLGRNDFSANAFLARGIDLVDLNLDAGGEPSPLRALDRVLSLARAVDSGPIALHSGDGLAWPDYIGAVVAAYLINQQGFRPAAAVAWIHMLAPWMFHGDSSPPP